MHVCNLKQPVGVLGINPQVPQVETLFLMRLSLVAIIFCLSLVSKSQTVAPPKVERIDNSINIEGDVSPAIPPTSDGVEEKIYSVVEQNAEYTGGMSALVKFISSTIVYPDYAKENEIQGKVYLQFVVRTDGSLSDIQVARSVPGASMLDKEAIRVLKLTSGKWKPAQQNGKPVSCRMNFPVSFVLQ
jgi:protein TonB